MLKVVWELDDGNTQGDAEYPDLTSALDGLAFWAREHEGRLNWIQIEFPEKA